MTPTPEREDVVAALAEARAEIARLKAVPVADSLHCYGMFDDHSFCKFDAISVEDLVEQWRNAIKNDSHRDVSLCPVFVMAGKTELRRVGNMLFPDWDARKPRDESSVASFISALNSDPDIPSLFAALRDAREGR